MNPYNQHGIRTRNLANSSRAPQYGLPLADTETRCVCARVCVRALQLHLLVGMGVARVHLGYALNALRLFLRATMPVPHSRNYLEMLVLEFEAAIVTCCRADTQVVFHTEAAARAWSGGDSRELDVCPGVVGDAAEGWGDRAACRAEGRGGCRGARQRSEWPGNLGNLVW